MALPTILGTGAGQNSGFQGPWIDGSGNVYALVEISADGAMFKATDPTSSFTEQDSGNRPVLNLASSGTDAVDAYQDGTKIHVASQDLTDGKITYARFDTSSDSWDDVNGTGVKEYVVFTPTSEGDSTGVSIVVRSDGDVVILHGGEAPVDKGDAVDNVAISYSSGTPTGSGSWTAGTALTSATAKNAGFFQGYAVLGASDRTHLAYLEESTADFKLETLTSANSLEAVATQTGTFNVITHGIAYTRSSTAKIAFQLQDTAETITRLHYDDGASSGPPTFTTETAESNADFSGSTYVQSGLGYDDGDADDQNYLGFVDGTTFDIHLRSDGGGTTWADENSGSAISDAITADRMSGTVYERGGNIVYAFTYEYNDGAGADVYYDEYVIRSAGPPPPRRILVIQ